MSEYIGKAVEVEMQRFSVFAAIMIASVGGSVGLLFTNDDRRIKTYAP